MKIFPLLACVTLAASTLCLSDCGGIPAQNAAAAQQALAVACSGVKAADGVFKVAAPALMAAVKLTGDNLVHEAIIVATVTQTCDNPPSDPVSAIIAIAGDAAQIYALVGIPTASKP